MNLYGIERATADLNMILKLDEENLRRFVGTVKDLGLKPKMPVKLDDFVDAKNPFFLLDIFVEIPFDFDKVYRKHKIINFEDTETSVIPIKELIRMQEKSNRPQDQADVFYLKKIIGEWRDEN